MTKRLFAAVALLCAWMAVAAPPVRAQNSGTFGTIVGAAATCTPANCVYYQIPLSPVYGPTPPAVSPWVVVTIAGTWSGTIQVASISAPNVNYTNLNSQPWTTLVSSATANGTWSVNTAAAAFLLVYASAWTSGTAQVSMAASLHPTVNPVFAGTLTANGMPVGGGSGTVNSGATNQVAVYPGVGTTVGGSNVLDLSGTAQAAGVQDSLTYYPRQSWTAPSGTDDSQRIAAMITQDMTAGVSGRKYLATATGAQTWSQNPFAPCTATSGAMPFVGPFEIDLIPNTQITANAEIDPCNDSMFDGGNRGYTNPGVTTPNGATIQMGSSFPTSVLMTDGPLSTSTNTAVSQGVKIQHVNLNGNGTSGKTGLLMAWGQEGTWVDDLQMASFQTCVAREGYGTAGSTQHNFGISHLHCELGGTTDTQQWGVTEGRLNAGAIGEKLSEISVIGGTNAAGVMRTALENDTSSGDHNLIWTESSQYDCANHMLHTGTTGDNTYNNCFALAANAPVVTAGINGYSAGWYDAGSIWNHISGNGTYQFVGLGEGEPLVKALVNESELLHYAHHSDPYSFSYFGTSKQAPNLVNLSGGSSFPNSVAWPFFLLPAKGTTMTLNGVVVASEAYMTTADAAAGTLPVGGCMAGQLAVATTTLRSCSLVRRGIGAGIFDGPVTAGDQVTISTSAIIGSAVGYHDTAGSPVVSGPYIGIVQTSVAAAPATLTGLSIATNCTGTCATSYSFCAVQRANADPRDFTQSACSATLTVSSCAVITTACTITISGLAPSTTTPQDIYCTAGCINLQSGGSGVGFLKEIYSGTTYVFNGTWGFGEIAPPIAMIAPPIDFDIHTLNPSAGVSDVNAGGGPAVGSIIINGTGVTQTGNTITINGPPTFGGLIEQTSLLVYASGFGNPMGGCTTQTTVVASASASNPAMNQGTSAAVAADCGGWSSGSKIYFAGDSYTSTFGFSLPNAADYGVASSRIWLGQSSCAPVTLGGSDTPACQILGIRFSPTAGDTAFQCVTSTGSAQTTTPITGAAPSAGTYVIATLTYTVGTGLTCALKIGASTFSATNTTNLPGALALYDDFANFSAAGTAVHLQMDKVTGQYTDGRLN